MERHRQTTSILIIVLVACQIWSGAAYSNRQSKWLTKHLGPHVVSRPDRHLQESVTTTGKNGYRASLMDEDHQLHTRFNLSPMERIQRAAEKSKARALGLDAKARAAPYYSGKDGYPGRKALQVAESSFAAPVEATPGSYSMAFSLGTPPQNFIAIADTGSDLVWIQCAACTVCFEQSSPLFSPGNSSTYTDLTCSGACDALGNNLQQCTPNCKYTYGYGDQSTTRGEFSADTVNLGNLNGTSTTPIPNFKFGCGLQNNGTFTDTDGIIGLARGPISFPSQIAPYLNNATKFSYCLVSKYENETVTSPIIFGEAAVPANVSEVLYTPILSPYNVSAVPFYYVNLQGISVGGVNVTIPDSALKIDASGNGGVIFDSGTTYTLLNSEAYRAVVDEFIAQVTQYPAVDWSTVVSLEVCYDVTGATRISVPRIVFHFENADFDLEFDNIVIRFRDTVGYSYICLALMESPGLSIFGNTQQQNFQIIYEEDALQIGWLLQDCETL